MNQFYVVVVVVIVLGLLIVMGFRRLIRLEAKAKNRVRESLQELKMKMSTASLSENYLIQDECDANDFPCGMTVRLSSRSAGISLVFFTFVDRAEEPEGVFYDSVLLYNEFRKNKKLYPISELGAAKLEFLSRILGPVPPRAA